ncbi:MAG TPA: MBL fold metallo-hydrolase [Pseudonocardiaceae bacterium]
MGDVRLVPAVAEVAEVVPGVYRLVLPLGIHDIPSMSAYLLADDDGDTLVDCGIAICAPAANGTALTSQDGTEPLAAALAACGSGFDRLARLVITHAHIDHFGLAGEVVRHAGAELWMHAETDRDLAKYAEPDESVDRRALMLADHGLYGGQLTEASEVLLEWMPVMPSIGRPTTRLHGGESFRAGDRTWSVLHTPGHSPGHICLWAAQDRLLCSGDHLLEGVSPPVTFERGFEHDPMGSYLRSLQTVRALEPDLVLPGHGEPFHNGARRAEAIDRGKRRRLAQVLALISADKNGAGDSARGRTVTELTAEMFRGELTGSQRHFAMAEILAYLAYHEVRGAAQRVREPDGVFVWRTVREATEEVSR